MSSSRWGDIVGDVAEWYFSASEALQAKDSDSVHGRLRNLVLHPARTSPSSDGDRRDRGRPPRRRDGVARRRSTGDEHEADHDEEEDKGDADEEPQGAAATAGLCWKAVECWSDETREQAILRTLLNGSLDLGACDRNRRTVLHWAAADGKVSVLSAALMMGADANARDAQEQTALVYGAFFGHVAIVVKLLEHGADTTPADIKGFTALHHAVTAGHEDVVSLLILNGASVTVRNAAGHTPFQCANTHMRTVLQQAIEETNRAEDERRDEASRRAREERSLRRRRPSAESSEADVAAGDVAASDAGTSDAATSDTRPARPRSRLRRPPVSFPASPFRSDAESDVSSPRDDRSSTPVGDGGEALRASLEAEIETLRAEARQLKRSRRRDADRHRAELLRERTERQDEVGDLQVQVRLLTEKNRRLLGHEINDLSLEQLQDLLRVVRAADERIAETITNKRVEARLHERLRKAHEDAEQDASGDGLCAVCWEERPAVCLVPCGHVCLCKACAAPVDMCPICRTPIEKRTPLFFSGVHDDDETSSKKS